MQIPRTIVRVSKYIPWYVEHTSLNLVYDNRKRDFTWFRSIQSERSFHLKLLSERVKCVAY